MLKARTPFVVAMLGIVSALPSPALAGGMELLPGGTRSVARGGAVMAKPEDPMVLAHNPAGLVAIGNQFMLNVDVTLHDMCVDSYGYYGWGAFNSPYESEFGDPLELDDPDEPTIGATYATTPLPEVCNSAPVLPLPQIAWAMRVNEGLAIGLGFVAPTVVTGLRFGGADGTIEVNGSTLPTPTRYQMIEQKIDFALAPSFGIAYQLFPELALGVNLQVAILGVRSFGVQNATSGTQPATDWFAEIEATDYFLPALTFAAHAKPIEELDLVVTFRWVDDFNGSGSVTYETNTYHQDSDIGPVPFENEPFDLASISVGLPWTLSAGVRYASRLPDEPKDGLRDPLDTERWDVELDGSYNLNERAEATNAAAGEDVSVVTRLAGSASGESTVALEDIEQLEVDRHLEDSIALRLGGSYAVAPREVALHAGGFFETRGIDPAFASIDSFAFQRFGMGVGMTVRLGSVDLLAAYGHIFQETMEIVPPEHEPVEDAVDGDVTSGFDQRVGGSFAANGTRVGGVVLTDPDAPSKGDAVAMGQQSSAVPAPSRPERIINAGKYTASFDVISIGVQYHF